MGHIKKTEMPTSWPIPRKGKRKRFVAVPSHSGTKGISILFLLRDVLKVTKTRKEARYMTLGKMVKVNNKIRTDENFPVQVFDSLTLEASDKKDNKNYRLQIVNRKFSLIEISEKEAGTKIVKISGKKSLDKKTVQMNLEDGENILTKEKFFVGDSVVLNTKEDKIEEVLPLKEGAKVEIIVGKHAGKKGSLVRFEELVRGKNYIVKLDDVEVSLPFKSVMVIK